MIYVDDIILATNNLASALFKQHLAGHFRIKDLGSLKYFLRIEVAHNVQWIFLSQRKYALDILSEAGMLGAKLAVFPMEQQHRLRDDLGDQFPHPDRYRRLVGRLIYFTIMHLELCYLVHVLSQFLQAPRQPHWDVVIQVLCYIKHNPGQGILLRIPTTLTFHAFCDSDGAAGCPMAQ